MLVHVVLGEAARRQGLESGFNSSFRGGVSLGFNIEQLLEGSPQLAWREDNLRRGVAAQMSAWTCCSCRTEWGRASIKVAVSWID